MKLQFESNQDYQLQAINSIVDLFEGQPLNKGEYEFSLSEADGSLALTQYGIGNRLQLIDDQILENLRVVQKRNGIKEITAKLDGMNFSVEMETGTGKTYVYLRTVYELSKKYGFKKFIIVVPSIAIREGVQKTLEITHEHFQSLYNKTPVSFQTYDSRNPSLLRGFASSNAVQILVINIDSFAKDENIINKENDKLSGKPPIEFLRATNPIVIVDEPQNMETDIRKKAIASLNPMCTLRYSATHTNLYNPVYRLGPVEAYDAGLVKQIEVDSVVTEQSFNQAYLKLVGVKAQKTKLSARIEIDCNTKESVKRKTITLKNGDDLYELSNHRDVYRERYIVDGLDAVAQTVSFSNGVVAQAGSVLGDFQDDVLKLQIRKTVEEHFEKERRLREREIKVLSLFFIDKVKHYRTYEDGTARKGKFAEWFEEVYRELASKPEYHGLIPYDAERVHNGYFSQDNKGILKDSREGRASEDDETAYHLIMQAKEKLLDVNEPLRFIFSHSALREGWDNPNVFQLCTLREASSERQKRQMVGRGLRLCFNSEGRRVFDRAINRLTVVANESFDQFSRELQTDIERETGEKFEGRIKDKNTKVDVRLKKGYEADPVFLDLWSRIRQKTTYRVDYDTDDLVKESARRIKELRAITPPKIVYSRTLIGMSKESITGATKYAKTYTIDSPKLVIPDLVGYIVSKTNLTRGTLYRILRESGRLSDALRNPQLFLDLVCTEINMVLSEKTINGIKYQKIAGDIYLMELFEDEEIEKYIDTLKAVRKQEKTLYNYIEYASDTERQFAEDCENRDDVEFYIKLPRGFVIKTPIGPYTPDWAIVLRHEKRLYFVAETKGSMQYGDLRSSEWNKIQCGYKHFEQFKAEEVEFKHGRTLDEIL